MESYPVGKASTLGGPQMNNMKEEEKSKNLVSSAIRINFSFKQDGEA